MAGKQAKVLSAGDLKRVMRAVSVSRYPLRGKVMILLSTKAGLRASEIAKLTWPMILTPNGEVGNLIELHNVAAKKGSGRSIPIHPLLKAALTRLRKEQPSTHRVIFSERGHAMTANSIVNWFRQLYQKADLKGCSSHSGRRTFITLAARRVHKAGGSLRDVQQLAGHRSIDMTQRYIEGDTDAKRRLVALI